MLNPKLTFFCELETDALEALFADPQVLGDLQALGAGVALALRDLSAERAAIVRRLNAADVPVTAWLLLPEEQGYWFNMDNAPQAIAVYGDFMAWSAAEDLQWAGVGLDIEPDMRAIARAFAGDRRVLWEMVRRALDGDRFRRAQLFYRRLVARIRADDFSVEAYVIPFMLDERRVGATLLQRLFGLLDLDVDRDVLMLYTSFMRPNGPGLLWSYAPEADSVAVGSTGGGVTVGGVDQIKPLTWDEFARDLRLAYHWSDAIHVFSLEGAVKQGFLSRLRGFDWAHAQPTPLRQFEKVQRARRVGRAVLWASAHPAWLLAALGGIAGLMFGLWRYAPRRRR